MTSLHAVTEPDWIEGPCTTGCGRTVRRERAIGRYTRMVNARPLLCDPCIERATREDLEREQARQELQHAPTVQRLIAESGLPVSHQRIALADLQHPESLRIAAGLWAANGGGLLLTGPIGVGKTTVAGAAALAMLHTGRRLLWTSAPLLMARLASGFGTEAHDLALEVLQGHHALVLDDLDKVRPTEYGAEQIFLAVDQRVEHHAPLLVTTNLSVGGIAQRWSEPSGEAIASRLAGYCRIINLGGTDRR